MDVWILRAAVGLVACVSISAVPTNLGIQNSPLGKSMLFPNKIHFWYYIPNSVRKPISRYPVTSRIHDIPQTVVSFTNRCSIHLFCSQK